MERLSQSLTENTRFFQQKFQNAMDFMLRELDLGGVPAALLGLDGLVNKQVITLSILDPLLAAPPPEKPGEAALAYIEGQVLATMEQKRVGDTAQALTLLMSGFALLLVEGCRRVWPSGCRALPPGARRSPERGDAAGRQGRLYRELPHQYRHDPPPPENHRPEIRKGGGGGPKPHPPGPLLPPGGGLPGDSGPGQAAPGRLRFADRAGGGVSLRLSGPGPALSGGGHDRAPRRGLREDRGGPHRHFGRGHPQRPAGALPLCGELPDLGRLPGPALLRHLPPLAEVRRLLFKRFFAGTVRGHRHPPSGDAPRGFAPQNRRVRVPDALPHHGRDPPALLPLRGAAGGGPPGAPVPLRHGEHRGRPGGRGYRRGRRTGGGALLLVVALTAIAGYAVPRLYEPLALLRLGFLLAGNFLGVWGVVIGLTVLLMDLCGTSSFGVPLLSPIAPFRGELAARDVLPGPTGAAWPAAGPRCRPCPAAGRSGNRRNTWHHPVQNSPSTG